jgi:Carboxypeptidase regulatory-like domain/TonB-dependent Receptor Plug Domain
MRRLVSCVLSLFSAAAVFAQTPTGTITGRVMSSDQPLAGVSIVVTGAASTAPRMTTTAATGDYTLTSLPPGRYKLAFEHDGLRGETRTIDLHIADTARVDVTLHASATEEIVVTPRASVADTPQVSSTFDAQLVEILPIGRSILDAVRIAPGVQDTGGGGGQLVINGAQSYDNLYLVNGVTISQEVNGQPHNLFIEDAIQETTVLTAGISAEYGRFTGGVVSVITKSGGNELSGSLRDTLTSDKWTARTPYPEPEHLDQIDHNYEGTLGGRVVRDRLWFFGAGRYARRSDARQTFGTNIPYTHRLDDNRYEGKLTATLAPQHSVVGSYISAKSRRVNDAGGLIADLRSTVTADVPNTLAALHYTGIFGRDLAGELQYSRKRYELGAIGGTSTDPVLGTVIEDIATGARAWSPMFCAVCGSNTYRNNHDFIAKATWFAATSRFGTHSVVAGVDDFHETLLENNHQSASDFMLVTPLTFSGQNVITQAVPGETVLVWQPLVAPASPTQFRSFAGFVNDRIDLGTHLSLNAGLRYDANSGHDMNGVRAIDDSRISPRIGAIFDVRGDGRHRISASYSVYAAKIAQPVTFETALAGQPAYIAYDYEGPELNTSGTPLPTDEVLRQVFAWLNSVERDDYLLDSFYPGGEEFAGPLKSPYTREVSVGYGETFGARGMVRADYVRRRWGSFYARRATLDLGRTKTAGGQVVDRIAVENSDADLLRKYSAVLLQGTYRLLDRLSLGGNYTWSRLTGNVENENGSGVAASAAEPAAFYPEYTNFAQNSPVGYLSSDVRHRANVWLAWTQRTGFGQFDLTLLERYHSARNYNATALLEMRRVVTKNPGYVATPSAAYFFAPRGSLRVDDVSATDFGFNWAIPIRAAQLFAQADVQNVFNAQAIENPGGVDKRVTVNRTDRNLAIFNPFTTAPVECPQGTATSSATCKNVANFQLSPTFGQPNNKLAYQQPRTFRISLGVRF